MIHDKTQDDWRQASRTAVVVAARKGNELAKRELSRRLSSESNQGK